MSSLARIASSSVAALLAIAVAAGSARAAIHTCTDPDGQLVYQDDPCDSPAMPSKGASRPAPAPAAVRPSPKGGRAKAAPAQAAPARLVAAKPLWVTTHAAPPAAAPKPFTSDPRWGSPERTLRTFVAAMRSGDRELVKSCLTSGALNAFGSRVDALPAETLRATVDAFTGFVAEGDLGPFWSIRALRGEDRPKWIFFERTGDGTWKISEI